MNHHEEALTDLLSDLRILRELEMSESARRWLDVAIERAETPRRYVAPDEVRDSEELWCRPQ